jgi:RNA polymerase sporulation-specific sigma factor
LEDILLLIDRVKNGDPSEKTEAYNKIYNRLSTDLKKMAAQYFIAGSDKMDIAQECRVGLLKAINDFNPDAGMSFKNFAVNVCCKRHLITSVSHANRKKFLIHNNSDSLENPTSDSDDSSLADFIPDESKGLLDEIVDEETVHIIKEILFSKLTDLEKSIIEEYLRGSSYKDIAKDLEVKTKTVDNALMRIRKKASEIHLKSNILNKQ